jgi:hypothetical protein
MWDLYRDNVFTHLGYKPTESDPALFYKYNRNFDPPLLSLIGTYVDDFPFVSQDPEEFDRVISTHKQWWNLKVKTEITKILGIKIHRTPNTTLMYDDNYFSEVAMELELYSRFHTKVTLPPNARYLPNTQYRASRELLELYQRLIGSLLWGTNNWRPDGAYLVGHLARFLANPSFEHLDAAIEVLYYFISTKNYGLLYTKSEFKLSNPLRLECLTYTDSDWDKEFDHVSVSGHVMQICTPIQRDMIESSPSGENPPLPMHNILSWFSRKQRDHVATSSEDAETTAALPSVQQTMWARGLFNELSFTATSVAGTTQTSVERPWLLLCDNSATVANLHSGKISKGNQHNARHFAYVRNEVKLRHILPWKVDTKINKADLMTKVLPLNDHYRHVSTMIGVYEKPAGQLSTNKSKKRRIAESSL